ncbi:MAG: carbamoyl-phosphate synthase large subunit [Fimbriimonadaceae bacterium]
MKVLVLGSGPIVIGQAAEFDYAGSQACKALREEGHEVILINSNPATIMTDPNMSDGLYIEPLTPEFCAWVIEKERPDALLPTLGGQTALNLAIALSDAGVLEKFDVRLLGTPLEAIKKAEDRESFRDLMREIGEPVPESWIIETVEQLEDLATRAPYPCIVRPAFTLGGTGGGIANTPAELIEIGKLGLSLSMKSQVMIERSLLGWKEVEYEVIRDSNGTCITVCNMENIDPMGVHTGDSIVVAPSQTLSDLEYHLLRNASLKIIRALGIEGGCNVQLAVNPDSFDYYIIEVNPRVSRSSALASKATGFPIARVAAKIAIGKHLHEIDNDVTKKTKASFEPALDYCVVKIPRWPFDKFTTGDRSLFTQMKATGEVMAIDRSFEGALEKALRGLETGPRSILHPKFASLDDETLQVAVSKPTDERLWAVAEALRRGWSIERVNELSNIDPWFLVRIRDLATQARPATEEKQVFKMVDTCAGEFESETPYFYRSPGVEDDRETLAVEDERPAVIVLGSGPIRIGQGIEFDYSCVHCAWAAQKAGYRAVLINNNPETVSTDFDTGDALYFEPIDVGTVKAVYEAENAVGVVCQFGGQTALNISAKLEAAGLHVLGTSTDAISLAEDRDRFERLLDGLGIARPAGKAVTTFEAGAAVADQIGYPVLVRPSFVLGGRAMEIVDNSSELRGLYEEAERAAEGQSVLVDQYVSGIEAEADVIADGETVLVAGIMEHIEHAGVHSGDSMAVYPPHSLSPEVIRQIVLQSCQLGRAIQVKGLMNIQFVVRDEEVMVIEVNPRASRTVPFLSKVTELPIVELATRVSLGARLADLGYQSGLWSPSSSTQGRLFESDLQENVVGELEFSKGKADLPSPRFYAIKAPVFSFLKLSKVDPGLGPEMKSTGEIMGIDFSYDAAVYKAFVGSNMKLQSGGMVGVTVRDRDKAAACALAKQLLALGFEIVATAGTFEALQRAGVAARSVNKIKVGPPNLLEMARAGQLDLLINTPSPDRESERDAIQTRLACVQAGVPCITNMQTAAAYVSTLAAMRDEHPISCERFESYLRA